MKPRTNQHSGLLMVSLCYRHRFIDPTQQWMARCADGEGSSLICRACSTLRVFKCRFCKCYLQGSSSVCDKCYHKLDPAELGSVKPKPQKDVKWRGVCSVCAEHKRATRTPWKKRVKGDFDDWHSKMWKKVRLDVRRSVETQFARYHAWLHEKKRSPMQEAAAYRRIERETCWISCDDGDLRVHYHNWTRRKVSSPIR